MRPSIIINALAGEHRERVGLLAIKLNDDRGIFF